MDKNLLLRRTRAPFLVVLCYLLSAGPVLSQQVQYRTARETAGYIEQKGWEVGLVRANPNLSHYNWSPMTTMIQAPVVIRVGTEIKMNRPDNHDVAGDKSSCPPTYTHTPYVKPNHVATLIDQSKYQPGNSLGGQLLPRHYVNPIKGDLNGTLLPRHYIKPIHEDVSASLINRSTAAQLSQVAHAAPAISQVANAAPAIASYGEGPHFRSGMVFRAKGDVNGTVISRGRLLGSR
jgi:hypothetical protein